MATAKRGLGKGLDIMIPERISDTKGLGDDNVS